MDLIATFFTFIFFEKLKKEEENFNGAITACGISIWLAWRGNIFNVDITGETKRPGVIGDGTCIYVP